LAANSTKIPPFSITVRSYSQQVRYYI
jgi:hypothetical protein